MPTIYRHKVKHEQTATFRRLQHSIYAAETSCLLLEQLQHNYDAMLLTILIILQYNTSIARSQD